MANVRPEASIHLESLVVVELLVVAVEASEQTAAGMEATKEMEATDLATA